MQDSNFQIRNAGRNDLDALFGLFEQVQTIHAKAEPEFFRELELDVFFEKYFEGVINDPEQYLVFACIEGMPVGCCQYFLGTRPKNIYQPDRRFAYINGLAVSRDYRRTGCATSLIGYVKKEVSKQDIALVGIDFWSFNDAARACFYTAGFKVIQEHMWLKL